MTKRQKIEKAVREAFKQFGLTAAYELVEAIAKKVEIELKD